MAARLIPIRGLADRLNGIGVGVQLLPRYVNLRQNRHSHDAVEMNCVVRGEGVHHLGRVAYPTGPGSLGIVHHTQEHDIITGPEGMEVINCYLDLQRLRLPDIGPDLGRDLARILPLHPSLRHRRNHFVHLRSADGGIERALRAMLAEQDGARPGWREALLAHFRLLLIELARCAQAGGSVPPPGGGSASDERMQEVAAALEEQLAEPLDLGRLAADTGMAKASLCRAFKRATGTTIAGYLMRQRLDAAMRRLRAGDEAVAGIALACGYEDVSLFNRHFRRVTGTTPTAWRKGG